MDPVLAIDLVKDTLSNFVGRVWRHFVPPLDSLKNLGAFIAIQNGGSLRR